MVGAGISGLAAAWYYRRARPSARILVLDNHDDFGGQAKRNEFTLDGRRIIGYGGSQSLQSPNSLYSPVAKSFLRDLGIDIKRFETAFERELYPSLGLSRGVFFNREAFGRDVLVTGEPARGNADDMPAAMPGRCRRSSPISRFRRKARRRSLRSMPGPPIRWPASRAREKSAILKATSYRDYLIKFCGCSEEAANCFQGRPLGFYGLGSDAVPAAEARDLGYPGFAGLNLPGGANPAWSEPYIYHFPDGNAALRAACWSARSFPPSRRAARWTTWSRRRSTTRGSTRTEQAVRVRLQSTCVNVAQAA